MNNFFIKKILHYFYQNDIEVKTDPESLFLRKKIFILLNENNQIFLKLNINNFLESYIKIYNLYFELDKSTTKEKIENTILDIRQLNNILNNTIHRNDLGFYNIYKYPDILNNNEFNNINYIIDNKISFLYDFNKRTPFNFYINNNINHNISHNKDIFLNAIENVIKENNNNIIDSLELKDYMRTRKSNKNIIQKKRAYKINKKNMFKVITKISRYRGVSKNKSKWQAYIRINKKNTYLGSYKNEKIAAQIYDIMSLNKKGLKAKTNFKYSHELIKKIYKTNLDIDDLYKISKQLN